MAKQAYAKINSTQTSQRPEVNVIERQRVNDTPVWMVLAAAFPAILVPLFILYLPAGFLVKDGYGLIILNEYQKYAAELLALGITLAAFLFPLIIRNFWPRAPRALTWATLLFMFAIVLSLFQSLDLWRGILVGLQVYFLPTVFFLVIATKRWTLPQGLTILCFSLGTGAVIAVIGIAQKMGVWEFALTLPHAGAGSLLYFQNLAGEYLIILIPPAIAIAFMPIRIPYRISAICVSALLSTHLIFTLARGAWVGLFCGLFAGILLACLGKFLARRFKRAVSATDDRDRLPNKRRPPVIIGVTVVLVVVTGLFFTQGLGESFSESPYVKELISINFSNTTGRLQIWSDSLEMLKDHWVGGVGPGHYKIHLPEYLREIPTVPYLFRWNVKTGALVSPFRPHNDYLQIWLELGLAGLVGVIWLFGTISWIAARGIGDSLINGDRVRTLMILGTFSGFSAWAVSMLFEFPFRMPASLLLGWLCAGMAVSFSLPGKKHIQASIHPFLNRIAGIVACVLIFICFMFAHRQFWSDVYCNQAITAGNNQNLQKSYEWISKAYEYTPWKEQASGTKARLELVLRRPEEALATSRAALQRSPNSLPALWANGLAAGALGHEQESRDAFQKIVNIFPFIPEIQKYRRYADRPLKPLE